MKNKQLSECVKCGRKSEVVMLGQHCPFCKDRDTLTPLGIELQKPCPRCEQPWIRHDCPSQHSGSIYKHIVYNPLMQNIKAVIQEAQDEENLNSGLEWQFVRVQSITEYEWVAIFEKWVY